MLLLFACCEGNKDADNLYFLKFKLIGSDSLAHEIDVPLKTPVTAYAYGLKNNDQVSVGFAINGTFKSPLDKEIAQNLSFSFATEVPETEFSADSQGGYTLKNPADFRNYLPPNNLFEHENLSVRSYFHEDTNTFCTAQLDTAFTQELNITSKNYYVDRNGNDALDVEGTFDTVYDLVCGEDKSINANGSFRIKVLLNTSPPG